MTLTRKQIRDFIYSKNIRTYAKNNIFGLMLENIGFNNIYAIEIYRFETTYIIYLKFGGIDILWSESQKHLDIYKTINPKYKFILQKYKDIPGLNKSN